MSRGVKVRYRLRFGPDTSAWPRKTIRKATERANAAIGALWFRTMLPRHFTNTARHEYAYTRREADYQKFKAAVEKRVTPLVGVDRGSHKSGLLQRSVQTTGLVRATPKKVTVRMEAPSYVKHRSRGGTGPDLSAELTALNERDTNAFIRVAEKLLTRFLRNEPKKKRTTTGAR